MQQVRRLETERLVAYFVAAGICISGSVVALVLSSLLLISVLTDLESWELLQVSKYGWQSLGIFWGELPKVELSTALAGLAVGIVIVVRLWQTAPLIIRKIRYLMKL